MFDIMDVTWQYELSSATLAAARHSQIIVVRVTTSSLNTLFLAYLGECDPQTGPTPAGCYAASVPISALQPTIVKYNPAMRTQGRIRMPAYNFLNKIQFRLYLIISLSVLCSSLIVFFIVYNAFYAITINDIREKTKIVHQYAQKNVSVESFNILKDPTDSTNKIYSQVQNSLNDIRKIANIRYLFTANFNKNKELVYIVDGLDPSSSDFRSIGDIIEPEITPMLQRCLNGNIVEAEDILSTEWGAIFFTCWPAKDDAGVTRGAIVMEFDAQNFYEQNSRNRLYTLIFSCLVALLFLGLAGYAVKRMLLIPLLQIEKAGHSVAQNDYTVRVPEDAGIYEIHSLQCTFNHMFSQFEDHIRKIRTAETARFKAEGLSKAKSDFLANISHEIRTPLNGIIGMLYLVLQTNLPEGQRNYLRHAEKSAKNLMDILSDILDFSKIEARKLRLEHKPFSLHTLADEAMALHKYTADKVGIQLQYYVDPAIPAVLLGDELRINQILNNIISNGIKFTPQGSVTVDFSLSRLTNTTATVSVRVEDTGIGIDEQTLKTLFSAFHQADLSSTRKYGGTGLGLVIAKQLLDLMGGTITVDSTPGKGSVFTFTLLLGLCDDAMQHKYENAVALSTGSTTSNKKALPLQGLLVLVAEDNEINQIVTKEILEQQGCEVDIAQDGLEATQKVVLKNYDIVLMDIQMPNMSGFEATAIIRQNSALNHLPIIAMTAHAMAQDFEKSLAAGMQAHVTKPIQPDILSDTIQTWVTKKP